MTPTVQQILAALLIAQCENCASKLVGLRNSPDGCILTISKKDAQCVPSPLFRVPANFHENRKNRKRRKR